MSYANFEFQARRIKFSLKKGSRERLFLQFKDANEKMRNLLESSDQIVAARIIHETSRDSPAMTYNMNDFWRHATRLHGALMKAWQCSCGDHIANLQLQHRTNDKVEFNILFEFGPKRPQASWLGTKIRMVPHDNSMAPVGASLDIQQTVPSPASVIGKVHWADIATSETLQPKLDQIQDLCSTLHTECPGFLGFIDEEDHHFLIYPESDRAAMAQMSTVTLQNLLQLANLMTRRKRYYLALILASSFLQLASTPWINAPLHKDSIIFVQEATDSNTIIIEQPYIRREMSQNSPAPTKEAISSLGIRLLELCFGLPLEDYPYRKILGPGDAISAHILDSAAAIHWSKMVSDEAGPEFADAIDWCLHAREHSNGTWRKDFWLKVVQPLIECHKHIAEANASRGS
jgi:hypothetical protein